MMPRRPSQAPDGERPNLRRGRSPRPASTPAASALPPHNPAAAPPAISQGIAVFLFGVLPRDEYDRIMLAVAGVLVIDEATPEALQACDELVRAAAVVRVRLDERLRKADEPTVEV